MTHNKCCWPPLASPCLPWPLMASYLSSMAHTRNRSPLAFIAVSWSLVATPDVNLSSQSFNVTLPDLPWPLMASCSSSKTLSQYKVCSLNWRHLFETLYVNVTLTGLPLPTLTSHCLHRTPLAYHCLPWSPLADLSNIYTCPLPLGLDLELDNCMPRPHQRYQSICRTSLIHLDVRIIKIEALPLAAKLRFHVSLPRGNTRGMSWTLVDVIHAPSDVIEQGLHQLKHVSGSAV